MNDGNGAQEGAFWGGTASGETIERRADRAVREYVHEPNPPAVARALLADLSAEALCQGYWDDVVSCQLDPGEAPPISRDVMTAAFARARAS